MRAICVQGGRGGQKRPKNCVHTSMAPNKSFSQYVILVSIFFFEGIGYLEGAQETPDLPQAVAPTGTDCAQPRGSERVKTPHHMDFYTK